MAQRATIWAVMPVKHLSHAKSRLASCLGAYRAEFAKRLMLHTLDALLASGIFDGILVVTPDDRIAALAADRRAEVVSDSGASLNEACALGLSASRSSGADLTVLVHADLALLCADDIGLLLANYRSACAAAHAAPVGLVRCKDGDGTNVVFCARETPFVPHFGPQSFARHATESQYCELVNANAAFDIDTGADVVRLIAQRDRLDAADPIALLLADDAMRQEALRRCA